MAQQKYKIIQGDVLTELKNLPADYFDAVLSDPPYGISFLGCVWDQGVPSTEVYTALMRVLKPGAFGLHFGGTRMWHRLAVNLEDSGFEIRDTLMWLYGSGFPKSHSLGKALDKKAGAARKVVGKKLANIGMQGGNFVNGTGGRGEIEITEAASEEAKLWEGYGTALKPAWEPCILVQKPLDGTYANNALAHHCGALNIDACRVGSELITQRQNTGGQKFGRRFSHGENLPVNGPSTVTEGRWPANLILDEEAGEILDAQSGTRPGGNYPAKRGKAVATAFASGQETEGGQRKMGDTGGASRFFYCAKVSTAERNGGCDSFDKKRPDDRDEVAAGHFHEKGIQPARNPHPTLKPLALTEYLARLLLPPKQKGKTRRILVPFSGAGSEMIGCLKAGWDEVWGIELSDEYVDIAHARIAHHTKAKKL